MSVTKKLKWRRALSKLRFFYDELEYAKEISKDGAREFEAYYRKFCAINNIDICALDEQNRERLNKLYGSNEIADNSAPDQGGIKDIGDTSIVHCNNQNINKEKDKEYEMTADDIAIHEAFSKLFKQIALKLHPDRIDKLLPDDERKSRVSMFQKVNQAFEDRKYFILLDVAEQYNIATPKNYEQQTRWMKQQHGAIQTITNKEKTTYNYSFSECTTEEEKDILIKNFIFQLFGIKIQ
jgi:hypothetical protein